MIKSYNSCGLYKLLPVFENILMMVKFGEYKMELHVVFHWRYNISVSGVSTILHIMSLYLHELSGHHT